SIDIANRVQKFVDCRTKDVYLQQEDVSAKMCCGSFGAEIGRVIVLERNGKKEVFQFESMQEARELLEKLKEAAPDLAIGYTEENRKRFEKEM
ncbi:MAG: hypothetical protein HFI15_12015, partial [Lachnospiraceae bacterium]|nr:hypothetical protein [Lachnospiraceae bacterium]